MTKEEWKALKKEKGMKVYVPKYWGAFFDYAQGL